MRVDLENSRLAIETRHSEVDFAAGYSAHSTEVLAQDEVRVATGEGVVVKRIQLVSCGQPSPNELVNFEGSEMFRVHPTDHDLSTLPRFGREIAFKGDSEKLICESEIENNFGG
jgi:hypothetical protein